MAEELLAKETINLTDIVKILGERPWPLKENIREYLQELRTRQEKESDDAAEKEKMVLTEEEDK